MLTSAALNHSEPGHDRNERWLTLQITVRLSSLLLFALFSFAGYGEAQSSRQQHTGRPRPFVSSVPQNQSPALADSNAFKPRFQAVAIGVVPGRTSTFLTLSRSVNNEGTVAGYSYNGQPGSLDQFLTAVPFIWHDNKIEALPLLSGASGAFAFGINDRGEVVGTSNGIDANGQATQSAVVWEHGHIVNLASLFPNSPASFASDVNNLGAVTGAFFSPDGSTEIPFVLRNGNVVVLPLLPGMTSAEAGRINDLGEIAGEQFAGGGALMVPCLWHPDGNEYVVRSLGGFGGSQGQAVGINELGFIAGWSNLTGDQHSHAFMWFGHLEDLGVLPGDTDSVAFDINDVNQIVGLSGTSTTLRTFLWERGQMTDLHDLVPPNTPPFNDNVGQINDRGEITVVSIDANGRETGFLLVPINEEP